MTVKNTKSTPAEAAAGQENLQKWLAENPSRGNLKHGANSKHMKKRYDDLRTSEGRQLRTVMEDLIADLGGSAVLTAPQRLFLDNIRSKLIVLFQISKYVSGQQSIINLKGELLPVLGRNYTTYSEALRRDLEALFGLKRRSSERSYDKALEGPGE